ncbi:hypothetical protein MalM25_27890 [Planctomycetes bacterium MalM25]|nr:hypothetical protein MalM25_27890 [Planctomycetes bacterium MalM25]
MAIDYPVRRPTRRCEASDRDLKPGERFVSVLMNEAGEVTRRDYAAERWTAPPEGAIAWWRSQMPARGDAEPAPREALLGLLDEWADHPEQTSARYVLALLLVRRRVLSVQADSFLSGLRGEEQDKPSDVLQLVCRERDDPFEIAVAPPSAEEAPEIQQRLSELLGAA